MKNQTRILYLALLPAILAFTKSLPSHAIDSTCNEDEAPQYVALIDPEQSKKRCSNDVSFSTIDKGAVSGIDTKENLTVKDETRWIQVWSRHAKSKTEPSVVPNVDFDSQMVIAVFQGDKSNNKDMVKIEKVRLFKDKMVVLLGHNKGLGSSSNKTTLRSYHIVSLPKTNLPVVFH